MTRIRVSAGGVDAGVEALSALPEVRRCVREGDVIEVAHAESCCNGLLSTLLTMGVEIHDVRSAKPDLEDLFLRSTKGGTS